MYRSLACCIALVGLAAPLVAQTATPDANTSMSTLQISSRAVLVDVIVSDSSGKPITGLAKDAFTVAEEGKPQTISFFEENGTAPSTQPVVEMPKLPPDVFTNFSPFPQPPAVNVLLLDSLNTPMEAQSEVHSQAMKYLKSARPGTRSAIFTMGLALHFIQGFTDDPAVLAAALGNKKNIEVETPLMLKSAAETKAMGIIDAHFIEENDTSRSIDREFRTLADLQRLAAYLQGFPGRKNVIWFTEAAPGTFLPGGVTGNPALDDELQKTITMLGTVRAALYPVYARGLSNLDRYTAESNAAVPYTDEFKDRATYQMNAQILAEQSGGRAFANRNGLAGIIDDVTSNSSHFYTLSYVPANTKMDGVFRKIGVKVAGGNYGLSYRRGYFAVDMDHPGRTTNAGDKKAQKMAASHPDAVDALLPFMDLGIPQNQQILYKVRIVPEAAVGGRPVEKKNRDHYTVDFAIDVNGLKLGLGADGLHKAALNISLMVYDRYGNIISREDHLAELNIKPDAYTAFQQAGVQLHAELAVPKGNYWLRTGVYDQGSHKVGTMEVALSSVVPLQVSPK